MRATPFTIDARFDTRRAEHHAGLSWDVERDVIRGRAFDFRQKFLPDSMSLLGGLAFIDRDERRLLGQIQGRTYANLFGLVEDLVSAKIRERRVGDSPRNRFAKKEVVRVASDARKHRALFRRVDGLIAEGMPAGYRFMPRANAVAEFVLARSTWAVRALTYCIDLSTQLHYHQSLAPDAQLSQLYKDVLFFHWKETSRRAILGEQSGCARTRA